MKKVFAFLGGILILSGLKAQTPPPVKKETGQPPVAKPMPDSGLNPLHKAYPDKTHKYLPIKKGDKLTPIKQTDKLTPIKQTDKLTPIKAQSPTILKKSAAPIKAGASTSKPDKL